MSIQMVKTLSNLHIWNTGDPGMDSTGTGQLLVPSVATESS